MSKYVPINLLKWIDKYKNEFKPPVGNKCVWKDGEFIVMIVGGPNKRNDYHYNRTPEFFYQIKGDITLRIQDNNKPKDISIKEGEIFLLEPNIPHQPRRGENTIGMVIEVQRPEGLMDGLVWYCDNCNNKLYEESFLLKNIEVDLKNIFEKFYTQSDFHVCKTCGFKTENPNS